MICSLFSRSNFYKNKYARHFVGMLHCSLCFYGHHLSCLVNHFDVAQRFGHTRKVKDLKMETRFSVSPQNVSSCKIHMAHRGIVEETTGADAVPIRSSSL